jgi:hypothetical protein
MDIKIQTDKSTRTRKDYAHNIEAILDDFKIGIITTQNWGNFKKCKTKNPDITITMDGKDYNMTLEEFKTIIGSHYKIKEESISKTDELLGNIPINEHWEIFKGRVSQLLDYYHINDPDDSVIKKTWYWLDDLKSQHMTLTKKNKERLLVFRKLLMKLMVALEKRISEI